MEFGNVMFLWGLPAVLLPLALHLFFKRRKAKVKFSTLMFFQRRERFLSYRRRLLEWLLLALRMLAILLLVLALSRIFFKKFNFATGTATGVMLVVDDTMSMQARLDSGMSAFDCAKRKAEEALSTLSGGDRAGIVWVSGRRGEELTNDREKIAAVLRQATVTGSGGSLAAAVTAAKAKLQTSPGLNREIYVFSDFRTGNETHSLAEIAGRGIRVFVMVLTGASDNVAVAPVVIDHAPKAVGRAVNIPFALSNSGRDARTVTATLEVEGRAVQQRSVTVPGGGDVGGNFVLMPEKSGWLTGDVKIDDGNLDLDNRAFFAFKVGGGIKILLAADVNGKLQDPLALLKTALDPVPGQAVNGFNAVTVEPSALEAANLSDAQAVVLALTAPLSHKSLVALTDWLRRGGVLLTLPPESQIRLYQDLAAAAGGGNPYLGVLERREASGVTFNQPLAGFNDLLQLDLVRWRQLAGLRVGGNIKVVAECQGKPLMTLVHCGNGCWLAWAFAAGREGSNWPLLRSFPVAATAIFDQLCGLSTAAQTAVCGPGQEVAALRREITYTTSWGTTGTLKGTHDRMLLTDTLWPGIVRFEGATVEIMVLQADAEESKLSAPATTPAALAGQLATLLDPGKDLVLQVRQYRQGSEWSGILLGLLLAVLTAEFILGLHYSHPAVPEVMPPVEAKTEGGDRS